MPSDTEPDLTEFLKLSRPRKAPCTIGLAMADLKPQERKQLAAACATDSGLITNKAILEWLEIRGHGEVSSPRLTSHRQRSCTCHASS